MMRSDLAVAPGNAEIVALEFDDAEGCSDQIDAPALAQESGELIVSDPVDFNIKVLGIAAEQRIANGSADDQRTEAAPVQVTNDFFEVGRELKHQSHCRE